MTQAIIERWNDALAVRLPAEAARRLALGEGGQVEVDVEGDAIVIRKAPGAGDLDSLFAGKSAAEWRAVYREAYDWGADLGREAVEE